MGFIGDAVFLAFIVSFINIPIAELTPNISTLIMMVSEESTKEMLHILKDSLVSAMDSVRTSVHDLHDESIELYSEINKLIEQFAFCSVEFDYNIEEINDKNIKYCFIMVVKEAFSNMIKHSNANHVKIIMNEHPAIYQLIVQDNGKSVNVREGDGIGLKGIEERVNNLHGNVNITSMHGFKIFISVPKYK